MCDLLECKDCRHNCKCDATDKEIEKMWEEFEDVLFIEARDFYKGDEDYKDDINLVLASDWQGWSTGTSVEVIWNWFNTHHSKGLSWLHDEYESE